MKRLKSKNRHISRNVYVLLTIIFAGLLIYINYDWLYQLLGEEMIISIDIILQVLILIANVAVGIQIWMATKFSPINKNIHTGALFFTLSICQLIAVMTYRTMPYSDYGGLSDFYNLLTLNFFPLGMVAIFSIAYKVTSSLYRAMIFSASILVAIAFGAVSIWQKEWIEFLLNDLNVMSWGRLSALVIQAMVIVLLFKFLNLSRHKNQLLLIASISFIIGTVFYTFANQQEGPIYFIGELLQFFAYMTLFRAIYYSSVEGPYNALEKSELRMQKMAYFDQETGLPNYRYLEEKLQSEFNNKEREHALVMIEIDRVNILKSLFGQRTITEALNNVAGKWKSVIDQEVLVQFSSHQFLLYIPHYSAPHLEQVLNTLQQSVDEPIQLKHLSLKVQFTAGMALFPKHADSLDRLMTCVHLASSEAHQKGVAYVEYSVSLDMQNREHVQLTYDLERAIAEHELFLEYQPQYDLQSRMITSVEALVRWRHKTHGIIPPIRFISLAEETGLIIPLGMEVLRTACREIKQWQDEHQRPLRVAVNLSLAQLYEDHFIDEVITVLQETGLEPQYLQLEITESFMSEATQIVPILNELKKIGITLAIDDFGTGYSSLSYLTDLPIDCVKVDRSFVNKIGISHKGEAIVTTILTLAESLHLSVVAEGVETSEQLQYLEEVGCHKIQGYYISRPIPFEQLLHDYHKIEKVYEML